MSLKTGMIFAMTGHGTEIACPKPCPYPVNSQARYRSGKGHRKRTHNKDKFRMF